jgi:hypothetical protein
MSNSFHYICEEFWLTVDGRPFARVDLSCEIVVDEGSGAGSCEYVFAVDADTGKAKRLPSCGLLDLIVAEVERRFNAGKITPPEYIRMPSSRRAA